jgi:hypothetical protein
MSLTVPFANRDNGSGGSILQFERLIRANCIGLLFDLITTQ